MPDTFRLTLAQLNPVLGDIRGNAASALAAWEEGRRAGADLVMLPEMFLIGYQPQDLVLKPAFVADALAVLGQLAADCAQGPALGIGAPWREGGRLYNAWHVLEGGRIAQSVLKHHRPNEEVFDEVRLYASGAVGRPFRVGAATIGAPVCEDLWPEDGPWRAGGAGAEVGGDPAKGTGGWPGNDGPPLVGVPICEDGWHEDVSATLARRGAEILIVPNGSPYHRGKQRTRHALMRRRVEETALPLVYLNMVGGQDDQLFDGASFVVNPGGDIALQLPFAEEAVVHVDFERTPAGWRALSGTVADVPGDYEADYRAMVVTLRDYLAKSGFGKVLLGLSGGVDSALVAAIAADAIGPGNVRCVMLPSRYTSAHSLEDAAGVAAALGTRLDTLPITGPQEAVGEVLSGLFAGRAPDIAEENVQSRLRGLLLMALSNKFGEMLLTTGNKSEVAVGYATIYGDMAGGYNPLKDLYKTRVFETCRWRNAHHRPWMLGPPGEVIPPRVIDKPPSAELRDDQKDEDSLPPYPVLDRILELLVDEDASVAEAVSEGFGRDLVKKVERLILMSEYKRFQSAPGTRLTKRAFWLDRRYPIVNRWRDPG